MTRLELGGLVLELTPEQVEEAREQLAVDAPIAAAPLSVREVAKRIGKSVDFVYGHAQELGGQKVGGAWLFDGAQLRSERQRGAPSQSRGSAPPRQRRRGKHNGSPTLEPRGSKPL
jgi:hypothetical protein